MVMFSNFCTSWNFCYLFMHILVLDKHNFQNNGLLYRFRYDDGTYRVKQESTYLIAGGLRVYLRLAGQHNSLLKYVELISKRKLE